VLAGAVLLVVAAQAEGGAWLTITRGPGTESCPAAPAVMAAVEGEMGRSPAATGVRCVLSRQGRHWQALIEVDGQGPSRRAIRTRGSSCRELTSALELTLTLALAAPVSPPVTAPSGPTLSPAPRAARHHPEPDPDPEMPAGLVARAPPPSPTGWAFSVGGVLSTGSLLELAAGVEVGARWRRGRFALALEGRSERALPAALGPARLEGWRASGAVVPCWIPARLAGCLVMRAGLFGARADGLPVPRSARGPLADAGFRAAWRPGAGPLAFYAELTTPLLRTRLLVDGRPLWTAPAAVVSLGLVGCTGR
jgi:hypothetical protein